MKVNYAAQLFIDCVAYILESVTYILVIKPNFTLQKFPECAYALLIMHLASALVMIIRKSCASSRKDL